MPPRKKAAPTDISSNATSDPPTTRTVRSSARLASQAIAVAANLDLTTDGTTSSKPASRARSKAASKTTKPASNSRSKRTKADADDEEDDAPASKKPKTTTVQEEEEEDAMDADTRNEKNDNKKMVITVLCLWFAPADTRIR